MFTSKKDFVIYSLKKISIGFLLGIGLGLAGRSVYKDGYIKGTKDTVFTYKVKEDGNEIDAPLVEYFDKTIHV